MLTALFCVNHKVLETVKQRGTQMPRLLRSTHIYERVLDDQEDS